MGAPNQQEAQDTFSRAQTSSLFSALRSELTVTADSESTSTLNSHVTSQGLLISGASSQNASQSLLISGSGSQNTSQSLNVSTALSTAVS